MKKPDIVPDRLKNPINFKILAFIVLAGIGIQFTLLNLSEDDSGNLALTISLSSTLIVALTSFFISKRYALTKIFGRAYLAYGIGYTCYFLGELLYYLFDFYFEIDPYPSIADAFYFLLYPFSLIYLILNIRFFQSKISNKTKLLLAIIPIVFLNEIQTIKKILEPTIQFYEEKSVENSKINILKKKKIQMNVFSGMTKKINAQFMSIGLLIVKCFHLIL